MRRLVVGTVLVGALACTNRPQFVGVWELQLEGAEPSCGFSPGDVMRWTFTRRGGVEQHLVTHVGGFGPLVSTRRGTFVVDRGEPRLRLEIAEQQDIQLNWKKSREVSVLRYALAGDELRVTLLETRHYGDEDQATVEEVAGNALQTCRFKRTTGVVR